MVYIAFGNPDPLMKPLLTLVLILCPMVIVAQDLPSGGPLKPEQAMMDIRHYTVALDVDPKERSIDGYAEIDLVLTAPADKLLFDFVNLLTIKDLLVNGKKMRHTHENNLIKVAMPSLPAGKVKVKVMYGGKPGVAEKPPWKGGFVWAADSLGNPWVTVVDQSEGATVLFPCKDHPSDEPNEGADLIITVPQGLYVTGPGLLVAQNNKSGKSTFHWKTNYTINNYSILFNIGNFVPVKRTYTTVNGNKVPMYFYVLKQHAYQAERFLDIFERCVRVEEKYFGEYPWIKEKMAITEAPHPGMEHQTSNTYGANFKYTSKGGKDYDEQVNHEFGHEWWGNKVTAADWADMWIQEGIDTFGDALYVRDYEGDDAYYKLMQRTAWRVENRKPVVPGVNINTDQVYQRDIYGKGAFFMHTIRYVIGDDIFFPTLKKLATDPAYTYDHLITTKDVELLFSAASGKDLKPLFDLFLRSTDKLEVSVRKVDAGKFEVRTMNLDMSVPIDIRTDTGVNRIMVGKSPVIVSSAQTPEIDPVVFYFKKVIIE
jgi:aminopeptidase N